jgi:AcrR family transcriptional regulator
VTSSAEATDWPDQTDPVYWSTPQERRQERRNRRDGGERPGTSRGNLTPEQIGAAALELIHDEGADRLTLRALAQRLGVGTTTLYWYVQDKDELLDLVRDQISLEILTRVDQTGGWSATLRSLAGLYRRMQVNYPGQSIWTGVSGTGPNILKVVDLLLCVMDQAGLSPDAAVTASGAFLGLVTSTTGWLSPPTPEKGTRRARAAARTMAYLAALPDTALPHLRFHSAALANASPDAHFQLLLDGLLERITAAANPPVSGGDDHSEQRTA